MFHVFGMYFFSWICALTFCVFFQFVCGLWVSFGRSFGHFLWKPRLPWKKVALSILNDPTAIWLVFGASGLPESKKKVKTMSTNGCANLHRKKTVAGRVFVDLNVLGGSVFDSISQFFDGKIASQILMEFRCRFGCRGAEGPGSARGGGLHPVYGIFRIRLPTPCGSPTDCRGG